MAEMIWDVPLQVIYTTSGAKLWRGQPDVKGSLVGTVKPEWAAFIKRAANCHAELVAALEAVQWQQQDFGSESFRCPVCYGQGGVGHYPDCLIGNALAKAKEGTLDESQMLLQDLDEETL